MIRTSRPPCAMRECLFLLAPIRCAADHASPALNAPLGLAVASCSQNQRTRSASVWASATLGAQPQALSRWMITCGKRRRGTRGTPRRASRRDITPAVVLAAAVIIGSAAMVVTAVIAVAAAVNPGATTTGPPFRIHSARTRRRRCDESRSASPCGQHDRGIAMVGGGGRIAFAEPARNVVRAAIEATEAAASSSST